MTVIHGEGQHLPAASERFAIRFTQPSFRLGRRRTLSFHGKGTVHFLQTGLVADGHMPQISLPFIDRVYHALISAPTSRTIPYAAITHHSILIQWMNRLAKIIVLTVLLPLVLALIILICLKGNPALFIPLVAIAAMLVAGIISGSPNYRIVFRDPNGRDRELMLGFRDKTVRSEFQDQLTRLIAEARRLEHPESASFMRVGRRRVTQDKVAMSQHNSATPWFISGLLHAWVAASAAFMAAVAIHLVISCAEGSTAARNSGMSAIETLFYQPGIQFHALLSDELVVHSRTLASKAIPFSASTRVVIAFWTLLAALCGALSGLARPTPDRNFRKAVLLAAWLSIAVVCVFVGGYVRQYMEYSAVVQNDDDSVSLVRPTLTFPSYATPPQSTLSTNEQEQRLHDIDNVRRMAADSVERAKNFENTKNFAEAERELQQALSQALRFDDKEQAVALIRQIAQMFRNSGNPLKAQQWIEKAIPMSAELSAISLDLALLHNMAGLNQEALNDSEAARAHFKEALSLLNSAGATNSQIAVVVRMNYAFLLQKLSEFTEARHHIDIVLSEPLTAVTPQTLAGVYVNSASNLMSFGRWGEAFNHASHGERIAAELAAKGLPGGNQLFASARIVQIAGFWSLTGNVIGLLILGSLALPLAWNAGRRGYPVLLWLVVGACSGFPMANLAILASIPDRRTELRRQELRCLLNEPQRDALKDDRTQNIDNRSIGDQTTV